MGNHFRPFTDVLREIWLAVTRKIAKDLRTADCTDPTDGFWAGVRRGGRLQWDAQFGTPGGRALPLLLNHVCICVIRVIRRDAYLGVREATIFSKRGSRRSGSQ